MSATHRERILTGIRAALRRGPLPPDDATITDAHLRVGAARIIPAIARGEPSALVARFKANAEAAAATVEQVAPDQIGQAVATFLRDRNLPGEVAVAADPRLDELVQSPSLSVTRRGQPLGTDGTGVSHALAGLAETGTVMLASGPHSPSTLNVLPDVHIIVIRADDIVGGLEDAWARLRNSHPEILPRTVHLITGPSRTGDIEQTIQLGAHGPRRVHIVLVDDPKASDRQA